MFSIPFYLLREHIWKIVLCLLVFSAGFLSGGAEIPGVTDFSPKEYAKSDCGGTYSFVNPQPFCTLTEEQLQVEFETLKKSLQSEIDTDTASGKASAISIFVRDLVSNRWLGINDLERYTPGSLLKLPLAVAYLKSAESDPSVLKKEVLFNGKVNYDSMQNIKPMSTLVPGQTYTIDDVLKEMMVNSDNNAASLLVNHIDGDFAEKVFLDLGITIPTDDNGGEQQFVSARTYGAILRALYNASYLNREQSNTLLSIMNEAAYKDGLKAGIPPTVNVSHKFGERRAMAADKNNAWVELHDCGVVYKPGRPYIICVMTKGNDFSNLSPVIERLSDITYQALE